jgi:hypothetical protein
VYASWEASRTARAPMNENLAAWTAIYELETEEVNDPWVGAANLIPPIAPAELDTMKAYISAQVFVPRMIIVTAADGDPETQRFAPIYERYFNSELRRIRSDGKTPLDHLKTVLHLGLRDGGGPMDLLFTERVEPKLIVTDEPKVVEDNVVLGDDGEPETERVVTHIEETIREVSFIPRLLKEWYLQPDESTSIQSAVGQSSVLWMYEAQMKALVEDGVFYEDAVERVLVRLNSGTSDVSSDPEGAYDKDAGGQINVGQGQGSMTSEFFTNRGPARIVRTFSYQYDLNGDKKPEKNVLWHHPDYPELLGWAPYEYVSGEWPTFCFSPFPRPDRPYGYSLIERLADLIADEAAGRNQRRNYIDLAILPLLLERDGDQIRDKDRAFYPGARWSVETPAGPNQSLTWFTLPALPPDSFQDTAETERWISRLTGQGAPVTGAQSSGRRSATEAKQQAAATSVRSNDAAMEFRSFANAVVQFWHKLNKQYLGATGKSATTFVPPEVAQASGGEKAGPLTIDGSIVNRKYNIAIAGMSDPTDATTFRAELMAAMETAFHLFPWIMASPKLAYAWAETFVDSFNWASAERYIGTMEEVVAMMQQAAQAQAAAQGQPSQPGAKPTGGQPSQNGHPQGAPH